MRPEPSVEEHGDVSQKKPPERGDGKSPRADFDEPVAFNYRQLFERAAELVDVPDDVILKMYDKLRPNRSTKLELVMMAQELLEKYNAKNCARLVMEAAEVYEKRGILL